MTIRQTDLQPNALGLSEVLMQAVTQVAPSLGILLLFQFIVTLAGVASPLVFIVAAAIILMVALPLSQLAGRYPSAGGLYTLVSRAVHPRAGYLVAFLYFLPIIPGPGLGLAFVGNVVSTELQTNYSINIPWWVFMAIGVVAVGLLMYRGVKLSGRTVVILGLIEIAIMIVLSAWGLFDPGKGGFNLSSFNPANGTSANGMYLAVVFSIFAFTGWEGAMPLAEESTNPRRLVPLATVLTPALVAVFFVFTTWGLLIGWGTDNIPSLVNSAELPPIVLAHKFWGGAWIIILLALINSMMALAIAGSNISTRMCFAMARSGSLPKALAKVHPVYRTPTNAIVLQTAISLVLAVGVGLTLGPQNGYFFYGLAATLATVVIYIALNVGVVREFRPDRTKTARSLTMYALFPLISTAAVIWVGYNSVVPLPAPPVQWAPLFAVGWLVAGIALLAWMRSRGREEWLAAAGAALESESAGSP
jgi:amino acid transporter